MKKALVVDDNAFSCRVVADYLDKHGWEVQACVSPFGVLNKVKDYSPDIILLDLNMPGLSGGKLAALLKDKKYEHGFRVISFSSQDESVQKDLVRKGLVDGYFVKNQSLEGLNEVVEWVNAGKKFAKAGGEAA